MQISVSFISSTSGNIEKTFLADFDKYFSVNKELSKAKEFVERGMTWEGAESHGAYLRIEAA